MTRYEAYITLYYALSNEAGKEDGLNENLNRFLERMNPFSSYSESSSDEDIYIRFCEKWDRVGSTVTSNSQNGGYTFAKYLSILCLNVLRPLMMLRNPFFSQIKMIGMKL